MKVIVTIFLSLIFIFAFFIPDIENITFVFSDLPDGNIGFDGCSFNTLTNNGAWCWFADPRAVYCNNSTYIGWVSRAGDIQVACCDHKTKEIKTVTLKNRFQNNDHANPALLMRNDRRLMVFYSAHGGEAMFYRIMKNPEDISSWYDEKVVGINTEGNRGYTYPNPVQLTRENNTIYLFWRGGNWKPCFATLKDGNSWGAVKTLIKGSGERPYIKYESDGVEKIHFAFTDGHPYNEKHNSIYYACYYNGAFYKADGTMFKDIEDIPINPSEADKVYDANISGVPAWIWDIAVDRSGNPVIVYTALPNDTDHRYRYARWNGSEWQDFEITSAGSWFPQSPKRQQIQQPHYSGGITLDHTNPSIVYLSRQVSGIFEIEKWMTHDGGASWTSEKITSGSKKNNIRPIVSRGHKPGDAELIWMYGDYINYDEFYTGLRMKQFKIDNDGYAQYRIYYNALNIKQNKTDSFIEKEKLPEKLALKQNYPNPFNPETTIEYQLPEEYFVNVKIFNLSGKEIRTLINERQQPGYYILKWNGTNESGLKIPSGLYLYQIKAGSFVQTKKMILLR